MFCAFSTSIKTGLLRNSTKWWKSPKTTKIVKEVPPLLWGLAKDDSVPPKSPLKNNTLFEMTVLLMVVEAGLLIHRLPALLLLLPPLFLVRYSLCSSAVWRPSHRKCLFWMAGSAAAGQKTLNASAGSLAASVFGARALSHCPLAQSWHLSGFWKWAWGWWYFYPV